MSDADDLDFELVTNARMLAAPPPLRNETVTLKDWKTQSGKAARFMVWELTAGDYAEFLESGWIYRDGQRKRYESKDDDIRFLAFCLRDQHGNRIWKKIEDARAVLGRLGKGDVNRLVAVATELNSAKEEATEGNFEEIQSDF